MKSSSRFVAGYLISAGAFALLGLTTLFRSPPLAAWGIIDLLVLLFVSLASLGGGVWLWRQPTMVGARELAVTIVGVQIPHVVLPGVAWSVTVGFAAMVRILGGGLDLAWQPMAFAFVRLGHHDAPFELGIDLVPLALVIALRRRRTSSPETTSPPLSAAG